MYDGLWVIKRLRLRVIVWRQSKLQPTLATCLSHVRTPLGWSLFTHEIRLVNQLLSRGWFSLSPPFAPWAIGVRSHQILVRQFQVQTKFIYIRITKQCNIILENTFFIYRVSSIPAIPYNNNSPFCNVRGKFSSSR